MHRLKGLNFYFSSLNILVSVLDIFFMKNMQNGKVIFFCRFFFIARAEKKNHVSRVTPSTLLVQKSIKASNYMLHTKWNVHQEQFIILKIEAYRIKALEKKYSSLDIW